MLYKAYASKTSEGWVLTVIDWMLKDYIPPLVTTPTWNPDTWATYKKVKKHLANSSKKYQKDIRLEKSLLSEAPFGDLYQTSDEEFMVKSLVWEYQDCKISFTFWSEVSEEKKPPDWEPSIEESLIFSFQKDGRYEYGVLENAGRIAPSWKALFIAQVLLSQRNFLRECKKGNEDFSETAEFWNVINESWSSLKILSKTSTKTRWEVVQNDWSFENPYRPNCDWEWCGERGRSFFLSCPYTSKKEHQKMNLESPCCPEAPRPFKISTEKGNAFIDWWWVKDHTEAIIKASGLDPQSERREFYGRTKEISSPEGSSQKRSFPSLKKKTPISLSQKTLVELQNQQESLLEKVSGEIRKTPI